MSYVASFTAELKVTPRRTARQPREEYQVQRDMRALAGSIIFRGPRTTVHGSCAGGTAPMLGTVAATGSWGECGNRVRCNHPIHPQRVRVTEKKRDLNQPGEVVVHAVGMTIDDNSFEPILGTSTIIIQA
jgi:hypothetical protein